MRIHLAGPNLFGIEAQLLFCPLLSIEILSTGLQDDFKPILRELLATHPGLEFLQSTPEFQERYGNFSVAHAALIQYDSRHS